MHARLIAAFSVLALVPALAGAGGGSTFPPPSDTTTVTLGPSSVVLWPYTGTDFSGTPSDPVNLFFRNTDPRAIREALLSLDGNRGQIVPPFPLPPIDSCVWMDGMGYEQTSWAENKGWVGSEVQLVCTPPGAPLGFPLRFHLRLFRQGRHTIGAAHFEYLIKDTAEHEVLSWDFARDFVKAEMERIGHGGASPETIPLHAIESFRSIRLPIYEGLASSPLGGLLDYLGIDPTDHDGAGNPVIPISGDAVVFFPHLPHRLRPSHTQLTTTVEYNVMAPKPFCGGPGDFVLIQGPVHFNLITTVDGHGRYVRRYAVDGELSVAPLGPMGPGAPSTALVRERHTAVLDRHEGQIREHASQTLFADTVQSIEWFLAAGGRDGYHIELQCD